MRGWGIWLLMLGFLLSGCRKEATAMKPRDEVEPVEVSDLSRDAEAWADSILARLPLRRKIAQMFMPAIYASSDYWTLRQACEYADSCIGGLILLKGDVAGARAITDSVSKNSPVVPFVAIDAEWGLAMRLVDAPEFPANAEISQRVDDQLMYDYGNELARECRLIGINMVLGPVVDVSVPGSFMSRRSLGDDPHRVADLSVAYARGLEDGDVISVAKHFPGHGSVSADSHKRKGVIRRTLNEMDSIDLYPFRLWTQQHLSGIMVGHLAVPSIDPELLPAAVSPVVINDLLRDDLGFKGLILTDAINMKGAEGYGAVDAISAGADIVLAPVNTDEEIQQVVRSVEEGSIQMSEIDSHVRKILVYKYLFGIHARSVARSRSSGERAESLYSPVSDTIYERLEGK